MEKIEHVQTAAFTVPTQSRECDGTLCWEDTTLVAVWLHSGNRSGFGYTYSSRSTADLIGEQLAPNLVGESPLQTQALHQKLQRKIRNLGRRGLAAHALSALDVAIWDLKAKLLEQPLISILPRCHQSVPAYGSGGFLNYSAEQILLQFAHWRERGVTQFKMKIGRQPEQELERVQKVAEGLEKGESLMVDANGAYSVKQALFMAENLADMKVIWFEEPVSSDDLDGLRFLRNQAREEVAAGEYGYEPGYFARMLTSEAVDVLQADATRCGGVTGFLEVCALAHAFERPLSAHTAPSLHCYLLACCAKARHVECFYDHEQIESELFVRRPEIKEGRLQPLSDEPGHGLEIDADQARDFAVQ